MIHLLSWMYYQQIVMSQNQHIGNLTFPTTRSQLVDQQKIRPLQKGTWQVKYLEGISKGSLNGLSEKGN